MKIKIISGGQTGADLAGLWVARCYGLQTGGHAPKDFVTTAGNKLELAQVFGLIEHSGGYRERTIENIKSGHCTFIFSRNLRSRGTVLTANTATKLSKPLFIVEDSRSESGFLDYFWGRGMMDFPQKYEAWNAALHYLVERSKPQTVGGVLYDGRDELVINFAGNASKDNKEAFDFAFIGLWIMLREFYMKTGRYNEIKYLETVDPVELAPFLRDDFTPERATELDNFVQKLRDA